MSNACKVLGAGFMVFAASSALGQSAAVGIEGPSSYIPGNPVQFTITLDGTDIGLGFAGWNIGVDVEGASIVEVTYATATTPLIDQENPFGGDPTPEIVGNSIELDEGLNAFSPVNAFHTGGALAIITLDLGVNTGGLRITTRVGSAPLGAFTYATAGTPPFSYVGTDFSEATYASWRVPTPGSSAVLAIGGVLAVRRRRV